MKSSQPARCTYSLQPDLLGSFPADVCPDITGQFGWGGVGGGKAVSRKMGVA